MTDKSKTDRGHPALEALQIVARYLIDPAAAEALQAEGYGQTEARVDARNLVTGSIIPMVEALLAERDKLLRFVIDFEAHHLGDGPDFHDGTELILLINRARRFRLAASRRAHKGQD